MDKHAVFHLNVNDNKLNWIIIFDSSFIYLFFGGGDNP